LSTDRLLDILAAKVIFPDAHLPVTGGSLEWERLLSAICITGQEYGSRSLTVLLIDQHAQVHFHERIITPGQTREFMTRFQIENRVG